MASHKPRIRSIKPEFWTDEKIAELPKATALFFIALWNFADDQGIIEDSSRGLALRIPIFRSQDIEKMLIALHKAGLIARSPSDGLVFIRGWKHQKIDRPSDGKWKRKKINWLMHCGSPMPSEESSTGSDGIGSDQIGGEGNETSPVSETEIEEAGKYYALQFAAKEKAMAPPIRDVDRETLRDLFSLKNPKISPEGMRRLISTFIWMEESFFDKRGRSLQVLQENFTKVWAKAATSPVRGVA
jgi:hypothetical protein